MHSLSPPARALALSHAWVWTHTDAVSAGDWAKYEKLCDKNLTVSEELCDKELVRPNACHPLKLRLSRRVSLTSCHRRRVTDCVSQELDVCVKRPCCVS
jgi:hypothetical protein